MKGIGLILLIFCSYANAKVVEFNGYALNTDTNIVTASSGMQWLNFNETIGMSINQALAANPGWSLASTEQTFDMLLDFHGYGDSGVEYVLDEEAQALGSRYAAQFLDIFGQTTSGFNAALTKYDSSRFLFGSDYDNDGNYQSLSSYVYYSIWGTKTSVNASDDIYHADNVSEGWGIALVNNATISPVPEPAMWLLFGIGTLLIARFRKH